MRIIVLLFIYGWVTALAGCVLMHTPQQTQNQELAANNQVKLGLAYLKEKDTVSAKEKLLLALQEAPNWPVAQDAMGYFLENTGNPITAEQYYQRAALMTTDHNGAAFNNYGTFLCRQHRVVEAEKMFLKAIADPTYLNTADAYQNAGLCALSAGQTQKARLYFQKAVQYNPLQEISQHALHKLAH